MDFNNLEFYENRKRKFLTKLRNSFMKKIVRAEKPFLPRLDFMNCMPLILNDILFAFPVTS